MNKLFTEEEIWVSRDMKRCSASLVIKEMQINTTVNDPAPKTWNSILINQIEINNVN